MAKLNRPIILILFLAAFLYFFQLGAPTVWDQDEGQMLASCLEMVKSGDYLTPHLNSAVYFHKPPLYAWLTALVFKLFGFAEFWGRAWAAVFGILGVYMTYQFARSLYNERAGLLSALIISTSPLYIVLSKMGSVDILLTFLVLSSVCFFYLGYKYPFREKWFYLMYASMALGTLAKGPLGIIIPALSIALFLSLEKKLSFIKEIVPLKGAVLFFAIASPWFIIETIRHGSYFLNMIFGQYLFTIYVSAQQQHPGPFYYYVFVILLGFIPWSGFFAASLFKRPHALPLSVVLVMLAVFSTASTKVPGYFLPAFPAMAVITGGFLDRILSGEFKPAFYFGSVLPVVILSVSVVAITAVRVPVEYIQAVVDLQLLVFIMLGLALLSFLPSIFKLRAILTIGGFALSVFVFFMGLIIWLLPYAENFKPSHDLALALKGYDRVAFYRTWLPPSLIFYLNRQKHPTVCVDIQKERELKAFLSQKSSAAYIPRSEEEKLAFKHRLLKEKAGYAIIKRGGAFK